MKKNSICFFLSLLLTSCDINNLASFDITNNSDSNISDSIDENTATITNTMIFDYGNFISNKATLLFGDSNIFFNYKDFGISKLYAGDEVTISYTGTLTFQETYPGTAILDGKIVDINVLPASKITFKVSKENNTYKINPIDSFYYGTSWVFPEYYVAENNDLISINDLYDGLMLEGTIATKKSSLFLDGLYKINDFEKKEDNSDKLNSFLNDFISIENDTLDKDYRAYYVINNTIKMIKQKHNDVYYFDYSNLGENFIYSKSQNKIKLYYNDIIYDVDNKTYQNHIETLFEPFQKILDIYDKYKPLTNNNTYDDYSFNISQIDPCCDGPFVLNVANGDNTYEIEYSTNYFNNYNFDDYIPYDNYFQNLKEAANKIKLDGQYSLLDEIDYSKIDQDKYTYNPGFGTFNFYLKDNENVVYESYAIPDCSFNIGSYISSIKINDKKFKFNNLTLSNSTNYIIETYKNLGFKATNNLPNNNIKTYIFTLNGVYIKLTVNLNYNENTSIEFYIPSTNIYKVCY